MEFRETRINQGSNETVACVRKEAKCSLCQVPGQSGVCGAPEDAGAGAGTAGGVR